MFNWFDTFWSWLADTIDFYWTQLIDLLLWLLDQLVLVLQSWILDIVDALSTWAVDAINALTGWVDLSPGELHFVGVTGWLLDALRIPDCFLVIMGALAVKVSIRMITGLIPFIRFRVVN